MALKDLIKDWWKKGTSESSSSIDLFKANFDGGARSNRFIVNLHCPALGLELKALRCESVSLPGRQLIHESFSHYGPMAAFPYNVDHDGNQVTMVFRCDSTFFDRLIIEAWQSFIFSGYESKNSGGMDGDGMGPPAPKKRSISAGESGLGSSLQPLFAYPKEYWGTVEIHQLYKDGSPALKYTLHEAYPIAYAAQELSMTTVDDILKFSCTIAFRTFTTSYEKAPELSLLNIGRRYLDLALNTLKLGSRYNKKAGSILNKLEDFDSKLGRLGGP